MMSDQDEVTDRLSHWARCIRSSNLPSDMIDTLAGAFEAVSVVEAPANGKPIEHERTIILGRSLSISKTIGGQTKSFPNDDLMRFLRLNPDVTETSLKFALNKVGGISKSRARSYIKRAKERIADGERPIAKPLPDHLQALLTSHVADEVRREFGYSIDG